MIRMHVLAIYTHFKSSPPMDGFDKLRWNVMQTMESPSAILRDNYEVGCFCSLVYKANLGAAKLLPDTCVT